MDGANGDSRNADEMQATMAESSVPPVTWQTSSPEDMRIWHSRMSEMSDLESEKLFTRSNTTTGRTTDAASIRSYAAQENARRQRIENSLSSNHTSQHSLFDCNTSP